MIGVGSIVSWKVEGYPDAKGRVALVNPEQGKFLVETNYDKDEEGGMIVMDAADLTEIKVAAMKASEGGNVKGFANSFGWAIMELKCGQRLARAGWNGKGMWLELQVPDVSSKMTLPYIYMRTVQGDLVPWLASQTDMLTDDWGTVPR